VQAKTVSVLDRRHPQKLVYRLRLVYMHKNVVQWGLFDMTESVDHEGAHTTAGQESIHPPKVSCGLIFGKGTKRKDISVKNARSTMHDHCTPGKVKISYGRGFTWRVLSRLGRSVSNK
jgi:hypothetical protein